MFARTAYSFLCYPLLALQCSRAPLRSFARSLAPELMGKRSASISFSFKPLYAAANYNHKNDNNKNNINDDDDRLNDDEG